DSQSSCTYFISEKLSSPRNMWSTWATIKDKSHIFRIRFKKYKSAKESGPPETPTKILSPLFNNWCCSIKVFTFNSNGSIFVILDSDGGYIFSIRLPQVNM